MAASLANATLPDLPQCTWDPGLGRSPKNLEVGEPAAQYVLNGVLRDTFGVPIANFPASQVELEILSPCANPVVLHPDADSAFDGSIQWGAAKLDQGGGACTGATAAWIRILPVGIMKIYTQVMSPDGNGDGIIGLQDLALFQQSFITQTHPEFGDLTLDGVIDLRDLGFFQRHFTAP
jgi:hypothetical protein